MHRSIVLAMFVFAVAIAAVPALGLSGAAVNPCKLVTAADAKAVLGAAPASRSSRMPVSISRAPMSRATSYVDGADASAHQVDVREECQGKSRAGGIHRGDRGVGLLRVWRIRPACLEERHRGHVRDLRRRQRPQARRASSKKGRRQSLARGLRPSNDCSRAHAATARQGALAAFHRTRVRARHRTPDTRPSKRQTRVPSYPDRPTAGCRDRVDRRRWITSATGFTAD